MKASDLFPQKQTVIRVIAELAKRGITLKSDRKGGFQAVKVTK